MPGSTSRLNFRTTAKGQHADVGRSKCTSVKVVNPRVDNRIAFGFAGYYRIHEKLVQDYSTDWPGGSQWNELAIEMELPRTQLDELREGGPKGNTRKP